MEMDREKEEAKEEAKRKVPVSLVTGFLGKGKRLAWFVLSRGVVVAELVSNAFSERWKSRNDRFTFNVLLNECRQWQNDVGSPKRNVEDVLDCVHSFT